MFYDCHFSEAEGTPRHAILATASKCFRERHSLSSLQYSARTYICMCIDVPLMILSA